MSNPLDPFHRKSGLAGLLSSSPPSNPLTQPSPGVSALFGSPAPSPFQSTGSAASDLLGLFSEPYRRRSEWNDRFTHWESERERR